MSAIEALIPLTAIIFVFGAPCIIVYMVLHYRERARQLRLDEGGQSETINDLRAYADKLEQRLQALETILDAEVPGWRKPAGRS